MRKIKKQQLIFNKNVLVELNAQRLGTVDSGRLQHQLEPTIIGGTIIVCTMSTYCTDTATIYQSPPYMPDTMAN